MHRYFVQDLNNDNFILEKDNLHHLKNVVKLKKDNEIICIFNNESYKAILIDIFDDYAIAKKIEKIGQEEIEYNVNLIIGLIREQKWDFVLQKATELGVNKIIPVEFKRSIVKISKDKEVQKIQRWSKICEDASEQSYKSFIPKITSIVRDLNDLKNYLSDCNICCYENGLNSKLKEIYGENKSFTFVVGPEGGLEQKEVELLEKIGFNIVKFSNNILRAETVPLYLLSTLMFNFE